MSLSSTTETVFAHEVEGHFAALLDFYGIEWEYEPTTFVLTEAADGSPLSAFTPDFFLPRYQMYVELTTLRQNLVTKKNKKVREMRKLYPDVRVKLLYRRDCASLVDKYPMASP